jgi:hypothetical protein
MQNNSVQQTDVLTKTVNMHQVVTPQLSDNAFYLLALSCQLKKLLGPASLQHFLTTGETVVFSKKAS